MLNSIIHLMFKDNILRSSGNTFSIVKLSSWTIATTVAISTIQHTVSVDRHNRKRLQQHTYLFQLQQNSNFYANNT
jgi:hypothetical protein